MNKDGNFYSCTGQLEMVPKGNNGTFPPIKVFWMNVEVIIFRSSGEDLCLWTMWTCLPFRARECCYWVGFTRETRLWTCSSSELSSLRKPTVFVHLGEGNKGLVFVCMHVWVCLQSQDSAISNSQSSMKPSDSWRNNGLLFHRAENIIELATFTFCVWLWRGVS